MMMATSPKHQIGDCLSTTMKMEDTFLSAALIPSLKIGPSRQESAVNIRSKLGIMREAQDPFSKSIL